MRVFGRAWQSLPKNLLKKGQKDCFFEWIPYLKKAESLLDFQFRFWIPAFTGMTAKENEVYHRGLSGRP